MKEKHKMYGMNKTAQSPQKERISFNFGQNMIHRVSHWKRNMDEFPSITINLEDSFTEVSKQKLK